MLTEDEDSEDRRRAEEFLRTRFARSQKHRARFVGDDAAAVRGLLNLDSKWKTLYDEVQAGIRSPESLDLYELAQQVTREVDFFEAVALDILAFVREHFAFRGGAYLRNRPQ